jgi:hypothetical protein
MAGKKGMKRGRGAGNSRKAFGKMTRKELYDMAKSRGHKGTSRLTKAELVELLRGGSPVPPAPKPRRGRSAKTAKGMGVSSMQSQRSKAQKISPEKRPENAPGPAREVPPPVSAAREPESVYVDWGYPLPEKYGLDRIGAFAKDPNWVFTYWDLSGSRREEVAQKHGADVFKVSRWHLRVKDLNRNEHVDLPVNVDTGNWYVPVSENGIFRIEIGLITPEGSFISFASTGRITTPRSQPSSNVSEKWMVADKEFQHFLRQAGETGSSELSSKELANHLKTKLSK